MMPSTVTPEFPAAGEFHLSLRVADLGRSTRFYSAFLGVSPKDSTARYSTFIVPHLRLNLVLLVNDRDEALDTYSLGDRKSNRMSTSMAHVWGVSGMHTGDCWVDFSKPVARDFSV